MYLTCEFQKELPVLTARAQHHHDFDETVREFDLIANDFEVGNLLILAKLISYEHSTVGFVDSNGNVAVE